MIDAKNFHPMRGDVRHDNQIRFSTGEILTLKDSMAGWKLVNSEGGIIKSFENNAYAVTSWIKSHESSPKY